MSRKLSDFIIYSAIGIAMIIFIASCVTEKKRAEICRTCALKIETKQRDSTGVPMIKRSTYDSLLTIKNAQGKTFDYKNCDSLMAALARSKDSTISATQNGVKGTISGKGGKVSFKCETDSLKAVIAMLREEVNTPHYQFKEKLVETPARCELRHINNTDSFFIVSGKCAWILLVILAIGLFLKKKFS